MTLVAPINLPYNLRTLWFDPKGLDLHADDKVVVKTARGIELGVCASDLIEATDEEIKGLSSELQPVLRIATEEDLEKAKEMEKLSREAMSTFKELARETSEDMHPVSVEYMLDGDKAVFYFEAEKRIDFRELVRKLASIFHVRIDMRQIGVRDEARIVGGLAHCGQVVCCKRLGGEFNPVSIKMAKHQNLSLNSQKISGLCGRLMCCLRYEEDIYKEFKAAAPKIDAVVHTPEGEGKVVEYDVVRDTVSVKIEDRKPIAVPLSAVYDISENHKECSVEDEAWEEAVEKANSEIYGVVQLIELPSFTGQDKLSSSKAVHHERAKKSDDVSPTEDKSSSKFATSSRSGHPDSQHKKRTSRSAGADSKSPENDTRKLRRRSTKISGASGEKEITSQDVSRTPSPATGVRPGQKSSALSQGRDANKFKAEKPRNSNASDGKGANRRRRRRRHSGSNSENGDK